MVAHVAGPDIRMHVMQLERGSFVVPGIWTGIIISCPYDGIHAFPYAARSSMLYALADTPNPICFAYSTITHQRLNVHLI